MKAIRALGSLGLVSSLTATVDAAVVEIDPTADLPAAIAALTPGDELVLAGGTYTLTSRLGITHVATADAPILIRSAAGAVAHLTRDASQNVINIEGSRYLVLRGLEVSGGSHGIRLDGSSFITVEDCEIRDTADVGLSANVTGSFYEGLVIRHNHIHDTGGTGEGMYLGCNDHACTMFDSLIANNYVHHTNGADVSQGDGIEIKDGSYGNVVRDNVIHDTGYPCILVYGTVGGAVNVIERNVMWNCGDHGIQAAADAIVRNNLILGAAANGIHSQNHQSAVPGNLVIVHNTVVVANTAVRVNAPDADVVIANNALYSSGGAALQLAGDASYFTVSGNVGTGTVTGASTGFDASGDLTADFEDAATRNVYPLAGSALIGAGDGAHVADDDFNGTARDGQADVGAYRYDASGNPGWTVEEGFKGATSGGSIPGSGGAAGSGAVVGTGAAAVAIEPGDDAQGGCGCRVAGRERRSFWPLLALTALGLVLRRTRTT